MHSLYWWYLVTGQGGPSIFNDVTEMGRGGGGGGYI